MTVGSTVARLTRAGRGALIACVIASPWRPALAAQIGGNFGIPARIEGVVSVAGLRSPPKRLPVFKNRHFCGTTVPDETVLISADGGLRNAVVLLRPENGKPFATAGGAMLDNRNCAFTPHVQVVPAGTRLLLKNSDPVLHTVRARLGKDTLFNVGLPKWRRVTKLLDRPGVVRIDCDVLHTWMSAAIVVADTQYFAITDSAGRFRIDAVPAGRYDMEVWHERLGSQRMGFALPSEGRHFVNVAFAANAK